MSKKKNTLKDLDEFLKQQAAMLVTPTPLKETKETMAKPEVEEKPQPVYYRPDSDAREKSPFQNKNDQPVSAAGIVNELKALADEEGMRFTDTFYSLIMQVMEFQDASSPEDKMLINTVLYLKHGDQWKEAIRAYWRNRSLNMKKEE